MDFRKECCLVWLVGNINSASAESIGMRVFREHRGGLHSLPLGRQCFLFLSRGQDDKGGAGKTHVFFPYRLICSGVYVCVYVQEIGLCVCRIVLAGACMCIWQPEVNFRDHFSGVTHLKVSCFHCTCACALVHIWRSGDALQELILSFHPVGPGDQTQVVSLGSLHLYPLSCLTGSTKPF